MAEEFLEPEEGDYTTGDWEHWYSYGKLVLTTGEGEDWQAAIRQHMDQERFWPNVWWISDHGNPHLLNLQGGDA